ncbi:hypothetical protein BDA96_10G196800 [Sorghum bicolor]|uniref:Secreted protein n=1 Tax=Sorghum bicolor TaxID=4558 RepID=A0A921U1I5_SORBI|nr:hypothetical protein BDA96_10G196800 [Sorghum bicolor]
MRKGSLNAACSVLKLLLPSLPCICRGSTLPMGDVHVAPKSPIGPPQRNLLLLPPSSRGGGVVGGSSIYLYKPESHRHRRSYTRHPKIFHWSTSVLPHLLPLPLVHLSQHAFKLQVGRQMMSGMFLRLQKNPIFNENKKDSFFITVLEFFSMSSANCTI